MLSTANGPLSARLLFVAEAPGRFGADVSGVPLHGDRTGRAFEDLLSVAGMTRDEVFVTNAVLCNPRDASGRNSRPSRPELANCRAHLARLIELLDPLWVVALGAVALGALRAVAAHDAVLARDVGRPLRSHGRRLVPLYHPGPRALIHRPLSTQRTDYARLGAFVRGELVELSGG